MDGCAYFLSALAKAKGLDSLVAVGYELLANPIVVADKAWRAISIASDAKISDDPSFNEFLTRGVLSFDTVSANLKAKLVDRIEQSAAPFVIMEPGMKYERLVGKVVIGSRSVAIISVIAANRPFDSGDADTVSMLCNAVSAEMQKNKFLHYTRGLLYEEFIAELIEGRLTSAAIINERARSLGLNTKKYIYILTVDIKGFDLEQFSLPYMRDYLEKMMAGSHALIYSDYITILTSYQRERDLFASDAPKLEAFLAQYNIKCGLSRPFGSLELIRPHYLQSLEALSLGERMDGGPKIYAYADYAVYYIARVCARADDIEAFCDPRLRLLMEYDREHKTSFTDSLHTYLKCSRNITKTANALHLHRNSMIYHLKRIEEILNIDISDSATLLSIELTFRFLEYDKKLPAK